MNKNSVSISIRLKYNSNNKLITNVLKEFIHFKTFSTKRKILNFKIGE